MTVKNDVPEGLSVSQQEELGRLRIMREKLELEHLQMSVENERARRAGIIQAHKVQQASLDDFNAKVKEQQATCKHKKGGKNMEGILNGNDANYSVIQHTYPWGQTDVICTRCGKEWPQPSLTLRKENPKEYKRLFAIWKEAMQLPTDNEPAGSQIFVITRTKAA